MRCLDAARFARSDSHLTSFRNKSSKEMAFPHPQSRKGNYRKGDKPNNGGVVWKLFEGTINVTDYRNAEDDVNRAENRTFGGVSHSIPFHREFAAHTFQPLPPGFSIVGLQKNKGCILFAVPASMHQRQFSRQEIHLIYFGILQELRILKSSCNSLPNRLFPLQWLL